MGLTLDQAPLGARLTVRDATGTGPSQRRLAALGLRRGAEVVLLQSTAGGGRLARVGGSRIALGPGVLRSLSVELA